MRRMGRGHRQPPQAGRPHDEERSGEAPTSFEGTVRRVVYRKEESDFAIVRVLVGAHEWSVKGDLGHLGVGSELRVLVGQWEHDAQYHRGGPDCSPDGCRGWTCRARSIDRADPSTPDGVVHYLASLDGVDETLARAIVSRLGPGCLADLDADPARLLAVRGHNVDHQAVRALAGQWRELRAKQRVHQQLAEYAFTDAQVDRMFAHFGAAVVGIVARDPYRLAEVDGVGFRVADRVARRQGIGTGDPRRLAAGVEYALGESERLGHTWLTRDGLVAHGQRLLGDRYGTIPAPRLHEAIAERLAAERLVAEEEGGVERIYTREYFYLETGLYEDIRAMLHAPARELPPLRRPTGAHAPTDEQWQAVETAFRERLSILTGGPGTGKSATLASVIGAFEQQQWSYTLCAPTGKAAKRMSEATGRKASTVHAALGVRALGHRYDEVYIEQAKARARAAEEARANPGRILRKARPGEGAGGGGDPLKQDVVVIDEASMCDTRLMAHVMRNLGEQTHVVLVGDPDQLPPVGAGSPMLDMLAADRVPTTRLTQIFRQAERSLLVQNAMRIRDGQEPFWTLAEAEAALGMHLVEDWRFVETDGERETGRRVLDETARLQARMGLADEDVLVLAPTRKGDNGIHALNEALGGTRNPSGQPVRGGDQPLRVGGLVMQTVNDNRLGVVNGDIGRLTHYNRDTRSATVVLDDREVVLSGDALHSLVPADAISIHKSQGSQAPGVVCGISSGTASRMLSRQLLYTGVTRASRQVVVVGERAAVRAAVARDGTARQTTLDLRIGRIGARLTDRYAAHPGLSSALFAPRRNVRRGEPSARPSVVA